MDLEPFFKMVDAMSEMGLGRVKTPVPPRA
jgi:hypothetical protein